MLPHFVTQALPSVVALLSPDGDPHFRHICTCLGLALTSLEANEMDIEALYPVEAFNALSRSPGVSLAVHQIRIYNSSTIVLEAAHGADAALLQSDNLLLLHQVRFELPVIEIMAHDFSFDCFKLE